jgi:hypothetical protein
MANCKARLGKELAEWFDQAGNLKPDIPGKKPAPYIPDEHPCLWVLHSSPTVENRDISPIDGSAEG